MKSLSQRTHKYKVRNDPISFGKNVFENNTTLDGYELLCIAVTNQAAEDYRRVLKRGINSPEAIALEKWFLSDWGDLYCFGMGDVILEKLQKELRMVEN